MNDRIYEYPDLIINKLKNLPVYQQRQVLDFVEFLSLKSASEQNNIKRVPDIHQGKIRMSDDFNEPLDDSFWLGDK